MPKPGDRRKRWKSTCQIEGCIMLGIAMMLFVAGGITGTGLGIIVAMLAMLDFRDSRRGWKMSNKRPPWADEHDAIDTKWKGRKKA